LLTISLLVGLFTFQDYGMAWDEYLYYEYADAIGYAYSIPAHLSPDFDLENAYGPSAGDHRNHGPGYILFARLGVYTLQTLTGIDRIPLWHLVNFLTFLVGAYFVYKISLRWLSPYSAIAATALYLTQPVLWEHGFINPKDTPFATTFIAALYFGLRMVDSFSAPKFDLRKNWPDMVITGILIGLATNQRMTGPLLGVMLFLYALLLRQKKSLLWFIPVALVAMGTTYITWPYIWETPIATFIEVLRLMASYSTTPNILFMGDLYRSYELPQRYLPWLLAITLTEPVWPLFFAGSVIAAIRFFKKRLAWKSLAIIVFWFAFMFVYVLILRPPMYDNYRHFHFILPPIFILGGFVFEEIHKRVAAKWIYGLFAFIVILPGVIAGFQLHPYQYTYYNTFVGGTGGAAGQYETDYWLTCYKEAIEQLAANVDEPVDLYVRREFYIAEYYAPENIRVHDFARDDLQAGDYVLWNSRADPGLQVLNETGFYAFTVEREGAVFCALKRQ
jgi:hypothetical protein